MFVGVNEETFENPMFKCLCVTLNRTDDEQNFSPANQDFQNGLLSYRTRKTFPTFKTMIARDVRFRKYSEVKNKNFNLNFRKNPRVEIDGNLYF